MDFFYHSYTEREYFQVCFYRDKKKKKKKITTSLTVKFIDKNRLLQSIQDYASFFNDLVLSYSP